MIEKDKLLVFGGQQQGEGYSPSNKVFMIDFSDSFKPQIKELKSMNFARMGWKRNYYARWKYFYKWWFFI